MPRSGRSPGERIGYPLQFSWASLVAQLVKNPTTIWETWVQSLGWEKPLEKGKATHSIILAWRIPWTVQSMWLQSRTQLSYFHHHLLLRNTDSRARRLQQWQHTGSGVVVTRLYSTGSIVVAHEPSLSSACGSSRIRDQTRVSCIGRQILYH